jgi:Na+-driven multidrug efflux pump
MGKYRKMTIKMTYEVIILGHLHMPLYFIGTFTEYSWEKSNLQDVFAQPLTFLLTTGVGLMLGIGASVVASIRLSENNVKAARIIITQAHMAGVVIVGVIVTMVLMWPKATVYILGCSPELESNATGYLVLLVPGMLFLMVECIGIMLIRIDGSPKYAMWSQLIPASLNIVLDYIMIFPMGMGIRGAALATSISCGIGAFIVLAYFVRFCDKLRFYRLKMSWTSLLLTLRNAGYMAKIGFATFLTECAMGVMIYVGNHAFMRLQGADGVAAYSIACFLFPVVFSIANAVAQSAQPIISFNYGIHRQERISRALRIALYTAVLCGIFVTFGIWVGAKPIASAFLSSDETAYTLAADGLPLFATCAVFFAVNITLIGYYQSIESAGRSICYTMLRGIIFIIPSFLVLPLILGIEGAWLAIPIAEALTLIVIVLHYLFKVQN